jgi:Asp-tRNA(Asn)/Glu-tRNA(Gln) amidotransferase A subunit family amidase
LLRLQLVAGGEPKVGKVGARIRASALGSVIHSRQVSCVEVMTAYLDHIERLNAWSNYVSGLVAPAANNVVVLGRK